MSVATKKPTIMKEFRIHEISAVDSPAQKPAKAVLLKRDDAAFAKACCLTTPAGEPAHTHLLRTSVSFDGTEVEAKAGETSYADGHFHPWIRRGDGTIVIGEARGHTHDLAVVTKKELPAMDTTDKAALEAKVTKAEGELATATKRAERAEKILALTPEHRAHFAKLDVAGQDAFLAKDASGRNADVEKANTADPVVFTAADGTVYRKSDDPRLVQMAKQRDADRQELAKLSTERANEALAKRAATELSNLPGAPETKVELLKAVDAIPAEHRPKVAELLKAANTGLASAFSARGTTGAGAPEGSAEAQLDALAKTEAAKSGTTFAKAYAKVLATPEGAELYAKHQAEKATAGR